MRFAGAAAVSGSSAADLEELLQALAARRWAAARTTEHVQCGDRAVEFGRCADELGPVRQTGTKAWWRSDLLPGVRESAALVSSSVGNGAARQRTRRSHEQLFVCIPLYFVLFFPSLFLMPVHP